MLVSQAVAALRTLAGDKKGATAIEYGVIAAGIIVLCIGTIMLIGPKLDGVFKSILNQLPAA